MKLSAICIVLFAIIFSSCVTSGAWTKDDINKKLKEVFPNATSIRIFNGNETGPDTFKMPEPIYKALVSEKDLPADGFIFYFYKGSVSDTAILKKILQATILTNLAAGFGTRKFQYIFSMPQFTYLENMLLVFGVSLSLPGTYDVKATEKIIRKVFGLAETKIKDVKITDPEKEKDH